MAKTDDLIAFLQKVVDKNTVGYKSDFGYDKTTLFEAAKAPRVEDRTFYWVSRPYGTWCVRECEVFLRDTGAHNIWTHYTTGNEDFIAFRVVVDGIDDHGRIYGEAFPIRYAEQIKRVEKTALPIHSVSGVYTDGEPFSMLCFCRSFAPAKTPSGGRAAPPSRRPTRWSRRRNRGDGARATQIEAQRSGFNLKAVDFVDSLSSAACGAVPASMSFVKHKRRLLGLSPKTHTNLRLLCIRFHTRLRAMRMPVAFSNEICIAVRRERRTVCLPLSAAFSRAA